MLGRVWIGRAKRACDRRLDSVWVANKSANTVTEFAHTGAISQTVSTAAGAFNAPSSIAISTDGSVWVTNQGNATVSRLTSAAATGSPYSEGGLDQPRFISFDYLGTAWVANGGNASVTAITNAGAATNYTPQAQPVRSA